MVSSGMIAFAVAYTFPTTTYIVSTVFLKKIYRNVRWMVGRRLY